MRGSVSDRISVRPNYYIGCVFTNNATNVTEHYVAPEMESRMIVKDLRMLLNKLDTECTRLLESSVGSCVNRGHYELTWEHILHEMILESSSGVKEVLRNHSVNVSDLEKALTRELEDIPAGSTAKPAFSPTLISILENAWSLAGLYYGANRVFAGALFVSGLESMARTMTKSALLLREMDPADVKKEIEQWAKEAGAGLESTASAVGTATPEDEEALSRFCTNFTQCARDGEIDPVSGRDDEIRQVLDILSRRRKNNPILVGEAGVGKTAVIEGLALRIAAGDVPEPMKDIEVWGLDLGLMQAGASVKGEFEKRLKSVVNAVKKSGGRYALFIDEAHTLIGSGGAAGQGDAANLLKPALARGELRTLAATTWSEYRQYVEKDPALARRFQLVKVDEPDEERAVSMLLGVAISYEKHHGVHITEAGVRAAVRLSDRYITGRQLPDKAVDVLDTACTRVKMSQTTTPASLDRARRTLFDLSRARDALHKDRNAGLPVDPENIKEVEEKIQEQQAEIATLSDRWEEEIRRVTRISDLQSELPELSGDAATGEDDRNELLNEIGELTADLEKFQGTSPMVFANVSPGVCAQVVGDWTGIPVGTMVRDDAKVLVELENRILGRVVGQNDLVTRLADDIRASKAGLGNPDAPLGVFLFTGPSGVGKTETALALADTLFGGERFLTTINMSEYQEKHTVSQLKGSPPGYVGYGEGGVLTEAVRQRPYSVVLLDEVEKAHIEVMNLFYQVFDKGIMRDGEGREIDFRNTLIIMTSNLASETIIDTCTDRPDTSIDEIIETIRPRLSAHFQPALLGRARILPFRPLSQDILVKIVGMKLNKIGRRLETTHKARLEWTDEVSSYLASQCTAVEAGARLLDATIGRTLLPKISRELLARIGEGEECMERVLVTLDENREFVIDFE